ncbi:hypothetical protein Dsin_014713 [Dipteronia sinensis]|uniref:F-box domain-containing protein n=1 Tax=Dipteronia sinensis TaxID=43782 RepID=A0AAE0AMX2_9ROSI|nr:hypothetical protein Dsin_014713 [Dipteronia sinensis]
MKSTYPKRVCTSNLTKLIGQHCLRGHCIAGIADQPEYSLFNRNPPIQERLHIRSNQIYRSTLLASYPMDSTKQLKLMKTDRLSNLPEPIIFHILSLMDIKSAFRTSLLSNEWKFHWTQFNFFSSFLSLENLSLIDCFVTDCWKVFNFEISAPRLVCLTISNFNIYELARIVISSTTLKLFNLNDNSHHPPLLRMENCQSLVRVNIDLFPPATTLARTGIFKETYIYHVFYMTTALRYLNPLRVSCTSLSKEGFLLYKNTQATEIKFVALKEIEDEWLLVALSMVHGLGLDQLATKLHENSKQKGSDQLAPIKLQLV